MYYLDTMKPYKLYKNKPFLYSISDEKKKYNGNIIFLDTKDKKDSINTINNKLINNKYTRCYYIEKNNFAYVKTAKKKKLINQSGYFKDVKSNCKYIMKTYNTLDKYENLSTYYDLSVMNELFYTNINASLRPKLEAYINYLNHIFDNEEFKKYNKHYILCKITNKYASYDEYRDSLKDFLSMLLNITFYMEDKVMNLPKLDIIVLGETSGRMFHFNLQTIQKTFLNGKLKRLLSLLIKLERNEELTKEEAKADDIAETEDVEMEDTTTEKELAKDMLKQQVVDKGSDSQEEIFMKIGEKVDSKDTNDLMELENDLNNDQEFLQFLDELKQEKIVAQNTAKNTARNELLKEQQKEVRINNDEKFPTIDEIVNESKEKSLKKEVLPINNKNEKVLQTSTLRDFEKSYNDNLDYKDKMTILNSMSDDNRQIKVYVRNISKEDTSTSFTKKETWTINLEDDRRLRHTIKVDFPLMINDKFMYIEGNKKILNKQLCLLPIIKTKPDTVQLVTNSNKTFIERFGQKISPKTEKFKKFLAEINNKGIVQVVLGNNVLSNKNYLTNIEYDELSEIYSSIKVGNTTIYFNQETIRDIFNEKKFAIPTDKNEVPIGISNGKPITYNMTTNVIKVGDTKTEINLVDFILDTITKKDSSTVEILNNINIPKKFTYTRCDIIKRKIPLMLFLAYNEGLSTVLHKAKISYQLSEKRRVLSANEKELTACIPFRDMYLYYDIYPLKNSLLMNSFLEVNTKDYDYEMFDSKEVYLEIFYNMYGSRAIAKGFDNFYELFIDGITKEVLEDMNYPTKVTELMLYANELLQDNQYILESDMSNYRIRSNEIINSIFEKELEAAYIVYKNSVNGATPIKISIPQNAIINALTTNKYGSILQDYDTLNPIKETDSTSTVTFKGPSGLSLVFNSLKIILISLWKQSYIIER